jgi:hypothetical protein
MSKKIVIQNLANAQQLRCVNIMFAENFINIGAVAIHFFCKPHNGMSIFFQSMANQFADVYFFVHTKQ